MDKTTHEIVEVLKKDEDGRAFYEKFLFTDKTNILPEPCLSTFKQLYLLSFSMHFIIPNVDEAISQKLILKSGDVSDLQTDLILLQQNYHKNLEKYRQLKLDFISSAEKKEV